MNTIVTFLTGTGVAFLIIATLRANKSKWIEKLPKYIQWILVISTAFAIYFLFFHYMDEQLEVYINEGRKTLASVIRGIGIGIIIGVFSILPVKFSSDRDSGTNS